MTTSAQPAGCDAASATAIAEGATGCRPISTSRFTNGAHHYVYEVGFADRAPVVVRIAADDGGTSMTGAATLSGRLRTLGVPLPGIVSDGTHGRPPHLVLERLPGTDFGNVAASLPATALEAIARDLARAQKHAARMPSAGRYGYAVDPADAPHERWSQVLEANLARSRRRMAEAGLFDLAAVAAVEAQVASARADLDALPPLPFLHDTTTRNVIVTAEGRLSGIVDVDDLCFGDPRYVIALTAAALRAFGGPLGYVDAWMKAADAEPDVLFRLYVVLFVVDLMAEQGHAFNGNRGASSVERRNHLTRVFHDCMNSLS
jgi:aminoglycoside phosphotransferase (APT) family kinase protein